jgi:non-specific serine/threonine protein kinase/serine/threonine-protein kinase
MNSERWQQVKQLLEKAIALNVAERRPFLDRVCAADSELRSEVESLLSSHEQAGTGFLKSPAVDLTSAPPAPTAPTRAGGRVGPYQIVAEIGHGGMGEVYSAFRADGQYEKQVAIKIVRRGSDTRSVLERFFNERQILASLDHPNIARLLDGGTTEDGVPYLVMELIEGQPIDQYFDAHQLTITQRLEIFRQICSAVQYAHQRLVIHRDIKPSNILVTADGAPKLLDFGIAKLLDPSGRSQTTLTMAMTPQYASPEQLRGETITTATDVYSLGVVLYQLLTGSSPYGDKTSTPHELARAICEQEPERPSTAISRSEVHTGDGRSATAVRPREWLGAKLRRRLAGDLDNIVLKAMRKEPQRRYASVEQFSEDIHRHLEGLPVTAAPDSLGYRASKFVRRHRVGVAATALIVVILIGGVTATVREAQIARAQRKRAETRFNDVRKLANALMFNIHDSVADLPGSTPARKLIVQNSLEYLDSLAQESSGDVSLQRELATAYEKVGEVQGDIVTANLGDTAGTLASYKKALAIRQAVTQANPASVEDHIALGGSLRHLCRVLLESVGDMAAALESCQQAVASTSAALQADPGNQKGRDELIEDYTDLGSVQSGNGTGGNLNDPAAGLESYRKALEVAERAAKDAPSDLDRQRLVGTLEGQTGDSLLEIGDRAEALRHFQQARVIFEKLAGSDRIARLNSAVVLHYIGDVYVIDEKFSAAHTYYSKELELASAISAADPKNVAGRMLLAGAHTNLGYCLVQMNRVREGVAHLNLALAQTNELMKASGSHQLQTDLALAEVFLGQGYEHINDSANALQHYSRALEIYSAITKADPKDAGTRVNLAQLYDRLGGVFVKSGNTTKADAQYRQALEIAESLVAASPRNAEALYAQANTYAGLGDLSVALAQTVSKGVERSKHLADAQDWYTKSLSTWQKVLNPSRISPKGFEVHGPSEVARRLSECKAGLAPVNKQLVNNAP